MLTDAQRDAMLRSEWLLTNRRAGFAMGTALGTHSRRYHGLLIAAAHPPVERILALHSLSEQISIDDQWLDLSTHCFNSDDGDVLHPQGWRMLASHTHTPNAQTTWTWRVARGDAEVLLTRQVSLTPGHNRVNVTYLCEAGDFPLRLRVRALAPLRDFHALTHDQTPEPQTARVGMDLVVEREDGYRLTLRAPVARKVKVDGQWWRDFVYAADRARGQDHIEHVWSPGWFEFDLGDAAPGPRAVELHAEFSTPADRDVSHADEFSRPDARTRPRWNAPADDRLSIAADQFVVRRRPRRDAGGLAEGSTSIIAGYPWFADWGRDAMIAVSGLLLVDDRTDEAIDVLLTFARAMHRGLIPNRFDDRVGSDAHYNTVDASLWFVYAVWQTRHTRSSVPAELIDACRDVVRAYRQGTMHHIGLCADGLITAGNATTQLTWMDAKRDGVVFTPRHGKAIEVNALWHNALHCLAAMTDDEDEAAEYRELAGRCAIAVQMQFWWPERQCCHDVLVPGVDEEDDAFAYRADYALRPNQIFAVSLPFSPLTEAMQRDVVRVVGERLLTPVGLRTLDQDDPEYCPRYAGDMTARDRAYHNGTVWPWLIGPYCEALLRVNDSDDASRHHVRDLLQPLLNELDHGCIGQLAEIYDGDPPHEPHGCPAQAWSIAEVRRVLALLS